MGLPPASLASATNQAETSVNTSATLGSCLEAYWQVFRVRGPTFNIPFLERISTNNKCFILKNQGGIHLHYYLCAIVLLCNVLIIQIRNAPEMQISPSSKYYFHFIFPMVCGLHGSFKLVCRKKFCKVCIVPKTNLEPKNTFKPHVPEIPFRGESPTEDGFHLSNLHR